MAYFSLPGCFSLDVRISTFITRINFPTEFLKERFGKDRLRLIISIVSLMLYAFTKLAASLYAAGNCACGGVTMYMCIHVSSTHILLYPFFMDRNYFGVHVGFECVCCCYFYGGCHRFVHSCRWAPHCSVRVFCLDSILQFFSLSIGAGQWLFFFSS